MCVGMHVRVCVHVLFPTGGEERRGDALSVFFILCDFVCDFVCECALVR
jgi:hypothetical protein